MNFWVCPSCNKKISTSVKACPHCRPNGQAATQAPVPSSVASLPPGEPVVEVASKYNAMGFISICIKATAALMVLSGVLMLFGDIPAAAKAGGLAGSIIFGVMIYAYSEAIDIAVDIEANQRKIIKILSEKP